MYDLSIKKFRYYLSTILIVPSYYNYTILIIRELSLKYNERASSESKAIVHYSLIKESWKFIRKIYYSRDFLLFLL